MRSFLIVSGALLVAAGLGTFALHEVFAADGIALGFHGTLATFLLLVAVPGCVIGLMRLVHLSHIRGYDEAAGSGVRHGEGESGDDRLHRS